MYVTKGARVLQGQTIALSGNTGHSERPHLHLTIREGPFQGIAVDPWLYLNH